MERGKGRRGFTLAEMLVVLAVMVLAIAIALPIFRNARAKTRRSDAVNAVRAALAAARQEAVRRRTTVAVEFLLDASGTSGRAMILVDKSDDLPEDSDRRLGQPIELPDFIEFEAVAPLWTLANGWPDDPTDTTDTTVLLAGIAPPHPDIVYRADGTAADDGGTTKIALLDTVENLRTVLRVLPATGLVVEAEHLQYPTLPEGTGNPRRKGWL